MIVVGWASTGGVASTVSGTNELPVSLSGGPWTVQIFINETNPSSPPLCGKTTTWEFTGDLVAELDYMTAISSTTSVWLFGMKGCDPPYSGTIIVQPKIDGLNFCDPLTLSFSGSGGGCGSDTCCFTSDFGDPCSGSGMNLGSSFPSLPFTDLGPNAGGAALYWDIVNIGTPAAVDVAISGDGTNYTGSYDGVTNIFGAFWQCTPYTDAEMTIPYCSPIFFNGIT